MFLDVIIQYTNGKNFFFNTSVRKWWRYIVFSDLKVQYEKWWGGILFSDVTLPYTNGEKIFFLDVTLQYTNGGKLYCFLRCATSVREWWGDILFSDVTHQYANGGDIRRYYVDLS